MQGPRAQYDDEVDAMDDPISDSDEDEHFGGKAVSTSHKKKEFLFLKRDSPWSLELAELNSQKREPVAIRLSPKLTRLISSIGPMTLLELLGLRHRRYTAQLRPKTSQRRNLNPTPCHALVGAKATVRAQSTPNFVMFATGHRLVLTPTPCDR